MVLLKQNMPLICSKCSARLIRPKITSCWTTQMCPNHRSYHSQHRGDSAETPRWAFLKANHSNQVLHRSGEITGPEMAHVQEGSARSSWTTSTWKRALVKLNGRQSQAHNTFPSPAIANLNSAFMTMRPQGFGFLSKIQLGFRKIKAETRGED